MTGDRKRQQQRPQHKVSIHARRVTGDFSTFSFPSASSVSIHARRVTGDTVTSNIQLFNLVSIHARRVTGDSVLLVGFASVKFQFTPVV